MPPLRPPGDAVLPVPGDGGDGRWLATLAAAAMDEGRVLLWFGDLPPSAPPTNALLATLRSAYSALAAVRPRADAVPLLPACGWSEAALAALPTLACVIDGRGDGEGAAAATLAAALTAAAGRDVPLVAVAPATPPPVPPPPPARPPLPPAPAPPYPRVAVGGTFDRLHAGHRLLLAASAAVARDALFVGITAARLLDGKAHAGLLQAYEEREAAAVAFCKAVRPGLAVETGALEDPAAPTAADADPSMAALVVSQETVAGGDRINAGRVAAGMAPLALVVVGLVAADGGGGGDKVSSTELRAEDSRKGEGVHVN